MAANDSPELGWCSERGSIALSDLVRELPEARLVHEGAGSVVITGVHHDSRHVVPGDLFVAKSGQHADGSNFIGEAEARGARAVLMAAAHSGVGIPVVLCRDVARGHAFAASAVYGHPTFGIDVVGITGTNGKTTTSFLVESALNRAGFRCGVVGTLGVRLGQLWAQSRFTSPEADEFARIAARLKRLGASHLVAEVSSIGLAAKRMDGVRYRVGAFTNLTQDHLDFHGSMEAYAEAKSRLFVDLSPAGVTSNIDDEFGRELLRRVAAGAERLSYARVTASADVRPKTVALHPEGIELIAATPSGDVTISSPLVGEHNVENLLCATAIGLLLGLTAEALSEGLSAKIAVPGRLERCDDPTRDDITVFVDYAHTPDALSRVLACVRPLARGSVICVFGCGGDRDPAKRPAMGGVAVSGADRVIITNDNPRSESPQAIVEGILPGVRNTGTPFEVSLDRKQAIHLAIEGASRGDIVVIAGKGHETYQIIGDVVLDFDDREIARDALAQRRGA